MGGSISRLFGSRIDRNVLILGREGVGKTHLLYKLKGLTTPTIELLPTSAFNHFQIDFHKFDRQIEVWDPSGKPSHQTFWKTFYENVYFNVLIYVIDAKEYDPLDPKRKANAIREDKMEIHTLLCEPELDDTEVFLLYLNWKVDELGRIADPLLREQVKATIHDDLELNSSASAFADRKEVIVVDEIEDLQTYMLNLTHRLVTDTGSGSGGASEKSKSKSKNNRASSSSSRKKSKSTAGARSGATTPRSKTPRQKSMSTKG